MFNMRVRPATPTVLRAVMAIGTAVVVGTGSGCATSQDVAIGRYDKVPSGAYAVVAEIRAKPGRENELRDATLPLVAQVRHEQNPKNLLYLLHEDREAPGHFIFYEVFASKTDFDAHNATPYVQAWFAKARELADGDVKAVHMEILGN